MHLFYMKLILDTKLITDTDSELCAIYMFKHADM